MDSLWTRAIWGLLLVQLSLAQIELNLTCRYAGVYHVEKNGRYSISRTEAPDLCKAFNSTLPTLEQMERALSIGFETCRYGFIEGHVVIPRKTPRFLCAANNTGVYILASNTSLYDTYCFNASAPLDAEDCSSVSDIPSVFEGQVTIGIVNPDGTRYTKKGEYRTNPDDINFNYNQDDDVSSGSAGERSTMGSSTIIQTSYPDVMTTSFNGLRNDDFETSSPAVTTSATTRATSEETIGNQDWQNWEHGPQNPEEQPQATTEVTAIVDMTRSDDRSYGENSTKESQHPLIFDGNHEDYDGHHSSSTTQDRYSRHETTSQSQDDSWIDYLDPISHPMEPYNPTRRNMDTAPHHSTADPNEGWIEDYGTTEQSPMATPEQNHPESTSRPRTGLEDGHEHSTAPSPTSFTDGETDGNFPEDSTTPVEDSISNFPDTNENTTHSSGAHMPTELPGMTEPTVSGGFASDNSGPDDSYPHRPRRPAVTGYSTPFPEGNQGQSGQTTDNRPRKAQIPGMFQLGKGRASDGETPQISVLMNDQRDQKENGHQGSFLLPFQSTEEGSKVDFIRAEQPNSSPLSHG
ncbi:CD44 antigen isoform X14 [Monodelphis domestica]|uniref:CD44 antigen isoform X14 n=1 Tax=Monodelphis domestica TaxID=13616 RepID=UPI0024E21470|nr:CD44 antigen isoform X14 [Monodelphis domestica]